VRDKTHSAEPMTTADALHEMELVGHDFYLFATRDRLPSVVYRRHGYDYGVIRLPPADAHAPARRRVRHARRRGRVPGWPGSTGRRPGAAPGAGPSSWRTALTDRPVRPGRRRPGLVVEPIRVLVVDDHALFRRGLQMVLEQEPDIEVVGEASDGAEAVTRRPRRCPTSC
jgi:CheY-like chemotaxis protein